MFTKLPLILFLIYLLLPLPVLAAYPSSEEQAVYNLNQGMIPTEVSQNIKEEDEGIINQALSAINTLFNNLKNILHQKPSQPGTLFIQSSSLHQAELPPELTPKQDNLWDKLKGFLGGSTGFYGVNLPDFSKDMDPKKPYVGNYEEFYEQANFPEGVEPITN